VRWSARFDDPIALQRGSKTGKVEHRDIMTRICA
jgi:hypothetical protein